MQNIDIFCLPILGPSVYRSLPSIPILTQDMFVGRIFFIIFRSALGLNQTNFGPLQRGSLTHPVLITTLFLVQPKDHRMPYEVGFQSQAEHISRN